MLLNSGRDAIADALADTTGFTGTAGSGGTTPTATTLTDSGSPAWTTDQWKGHVVVAPGVYGVVQSNTSSVLTVDKWYTPATPGGAAATTPSASVTYTIVAGNQPAFWVALTANATSPTATDTTLTSEETTNGLARKVTAYAHTDGQATFTLTATWTATGGTTTINKIGVFNSSSVSTARMFYETAVTSGPTLVTNDQLTVTETVTLS